MVAAAAAATATASSDTQQHPAPRVLSRRLTLGPDVCWCVCVCVWVWGTRQKLVRRVPSFEAGISCDSLLACSATTTSSSTGRTAYFRDAETGTLARWVIRRILFGCGIDVSCESGSDPKQELVRRVPSFEAGIPSDSLLVCAPVTGPWSPWTHDRCLSMWFHIHMGPSTGVLLLGVSPPPLFFGGRGGRRPDGPSIRL